MLVGLGGAMLPLLLHFLSRSRYRDVQWGAMLFLTGADRRQRQNARMNQILLLLLRMAMVAVLAVALARPVLQAGTASTEGGRLTAVILLDCSGSMSFNENGRQRFDLARRAAEEILAALHPGDRAALVLMGEPSESADAEPTTDLRAVANRIDQIRCGFGVANEREALDRAADILTRHEKASRYVYIIADRQALSWANVDGAFSAAWRDRMLTPAPGGPKRVNFRAFFVPIGSSDASSVAVESASLVNPPAIRGEPAEIEVRLHNYDAAPRADLPLTLRDGSRVLLQTHVNLPPNATSTLRFDSMGGDRKIVFPNAGSQVLTAEITTTGFTADDHFDASIDVIDPIKVLLISGDARVAPFQSETDFIRWALAPHQAAHQKQESDPCAVTVLGADTWSGDEIDPYQVVILANIERFDAEQVRALERYVYAGGRLLIAPGDLSRVEDYNAELYRDGAGLLPAELQPATPGDGSAATTLLGYDSTHAIFQFLRGRPDPIPQATIGRYFPAVARQTYAWPLAWYASGDPFLIEGSSERGRVILMTTSLDADWSTLPLSNFYLPFLQNMVRYLASNPAHRNLLPGDAIQVGFANGDAPRRVWLSGPGLTRRPMEVVRFGQQAEVRFTDTARPGQYRLDVEEPGRSPYSIFFVVSPPPQESDLTQLTPEQSTTLKSNLSLRLIDPAKESIGAAATADRSGSELWGAGILCLLALAFVEMGVARLQSGGGER